MQLGRSPLDMLCIICCWVHWLFGAVGPAAPLLWPALLLGVLRPCCHNQRHPPVPCARKRALYAPRFTPRGRQTTNICPHSSASAASCCALVAQCACCVCYMVCAAGGFAPLGLTR